MSKYCRHGALAERCPICHGSVETPAGRSAAGAGQRSATDTRPRRNLSSRGGMVVRREARTLDDGYRSALAPGLRSTQDAVRLASEIGFACGRLSTIEHDPPGLYAAIAAEPDLEEATWLAFLVVYLGPLEEPDPFGAIESVRTPWGTLPVLADVRVGPRAAHDRDRGTDTLTAYRRFVERAGSQELAFTGDPSWSATQRFERVYERLALPGLHRRARYDLLVTLGLLGRYPLAAPGLLLTEDDAVTLAAKRVFGIGDRLNLQRRARELAAAAQAPVAALDLAIENWAREAERITQGMPDADDEFAEARARAALGC